MATFNDVEGSRPNRVKNASEVIAMAEKDLAENHRVLEGAKAFLAQNPDFEDYKTLMRNYNY